MPPVVYVIVVKTGMQAHAHTRSLSRAHTHVHTHSSFPILLLLLFEGKWRDLSLWLVITPEIREHTLLCNCSDDKKNPKKNQTSVTAAVDKMPVYVLTYPGLKCAPWCLLICPAVCIYESISPQVSGGAPSVPALHSSGGPSVRLCLTLRPRQAVEKPPTHPPFSFFSHSSVQLMKTHLLSLFAGYCPPPHPNRITQANHSREVSCRILVSFRRGSSVGQSTLHLSPGVDVGLRERRGRMGKESAVAVTAASASVTVSSSLARNAFHLSFSLPLSAPPLYLPPCPFFSVTVYLLLLQLFGFTIQHAAGRTEQAPSLNG